MSEPSTSLGACVPLHPSAASEEDLELPPLTNNCDRPCGGDMTVKPPEPYVLTITNLPDENA